MRARKKRVINGFNVSWFWQFFMVLDVVCGMEIDEKAAKWKSEYKGKTYFFCGPMCKLEFDATPQKYVPVDTTKVDK